MERIHVAPVTRGEYCARRREYWLAVNRDCGMEATESALVAMVEQDAEAVEAAGVTWPAAPSADRPRPDEAVYRSAQDKLAPAIDLFCELYDALGTEERAVVDRLVSDRFGAMTFPEAGAVHG